MKNTGSLSGISTQSILKPPSQAELAEKANLREVYFTRDMANTENILRSDLKAYVDNGDISRMRPIVLDELLPSFFKKVCNVYDSPPLFKFEEGTDQADTDSFNALSDETQLNRVMPETLERSRFHNTIIAYVRYFKPLDKVYIENSWHAGNCLIETFEGYDQEMRKFSYIQDGDGETQYRIYWELVKYNDDGTAKTLHYKIKLTESGEIPESSAEKREPIGDNKDLEGPPYWPFVVYRYSERGRGFWGNAMDSLVELVRAINILLTVANDDTIQETIRILLLNFNPTGTVGERQQLKTGLRHPISPDDQLGKDKMDGKILSADLYNEDVLKLIEGLWSVVANTHNVGNVLKPDFKQALSAIALKVQNEPQLRDWEHDINVVTPLDMKLIKTMIAVNNYHRKGNDKAQIKAEIAEKLFIEYQEPNLVTDEKTEYELEQKKWDDGTSSPLLYVMRQNPEMSEKEATEYIENNLKVNNDLLGISPRGEGQTEDEIINAEPIIE